jgi:predicted nucleic-acid-binding protein
MIGIDTNVIVRLLTRDDPEQFDAAVRLVKASGPDRPLFVNPIVVAETIWVLERIYKTDRVTARKQVAGLLDTVEIKVPETMQIDGWSEWLKSPHPDFADVIIAGLNSANGCETTMTFDRKAAQSVPGMELLA